MDPKAENVIHNVGAIAETTSIFYNSISGRVPKDVALALTQHFMDLSMSRKPTPNAAVILQALRAAEAYRHRQEKQSQTPEQSQTQTPQSADPASQTEPQAQAAAETSQPSAPAPQEPQPELPPESV